jgi:hypothetical protein
MAGVLHGSARTTPRVRAELRAPSIEREDKRPRQAIWPEQNNSREVADADFDGRCSHGPARSPQHGPDACRGSDHCRISTKNAVPLDDLMGCLKDTIPKLSRSRLYRCLARHGISRRPESEVSDSKRGSFAETPIGYVHIDHCELRLASGKLHMFLAIDRISKFTYVEFHDRTNMLNGAAFLESVIAAFPYKSIQS